VGEHRVDSRAAVAGLAQSRPSTTIRLSSRGKVLDRIRHSARRSRCSPRTRLSLSADFIWVESLIRPDCRYIAICCA
jgi:hypothetical protein